MSVPHSLRLPPDLEKRVLNLNEATTVSKQALLALAVRAGLPSVEEKLLQLSAVDSGKRRKSHG